MNRSPFGPNSSANILTRKFQTFPLEDLIAEFFWIFLLFAGLYCTNIKNNTKHPYNGFISCLSMGYVIMFYTRSNTHLTYICVHPPQHTLPHTHTHIVCNASVFNKRPGVKRKKNEENPAWRDFRMKNDIRPVNFGSKSELWVTFPFSLSFFDINFPDDKFSRIF